MGKVLIAFKARIINNGLSTRMDM